jgi:hypothetical protein
VAKSRIMVAAAIGLAVFALSGLGYAARAQADTGTVTVVHGVPDLTVDVYVNGNLTLEDFAPGTITDPLELPAGDYALEIYPADADPEASDPAISGSTTLPSGANASVIAHLDEMGAPTLSVFVNDVSATEAGSARVVVRHTAAAPAVDVLVDGAPAITNLANPDEAAADLPAGTYSAAVAATGTTDPVLGPVDLTLEAGTAYFVYAIGSLEGQNLDLLIQTVSGLEAAAPAPAEAPPAAVSAAPAAGTGHLSDSGYLVWAIIGLLLGGTVLSVTGLAAARLVRGWR